MTGERNTLRHILLRFGFLIVFAAFFLLFAAWNPVFLQGGNLMNIIEGSAILMIVALGLTLIVATGGIDLSIGIALDFGAAFAVVAMRSYGLDWFSAACAGVIGGSLVGLFNALLVVGLRISPFLATLSTFFIGSSVQRIFTNGGGPISHRRMPEEFRNLALGDVFGVPTEAVIALVLVLLYYLVLERSIWGRRIHAMGMQRSAAVVAGIRVNRILILCFVAAA
ncbi:MAG: ABC transporter permease, partial [Pseudomonadota bacterium]